MRGGIQDVPVTNHIRYSLDNLFVRGCFFLILESSAVFFIHLCRHFKRDMSCADGCCVSICVQQLQWRCPSAWKRGVQKGWLAFCGVFVPCVGPSQDAKQESQIRSSLSRRVLCLFRRHVMPFCTWESPGPPFSPCTAFGRTAWVIRRLCLDDWISRRRRFHASVGFT